MSSTKAPRRRKAGEPAYPTQKPPLQLLKPSSECSTTRLIHEQSQEVKAALDDMRRRSRAARCRIKPEDDTPDAA
jgi:hypothetical protein